MIVSIMCKSGVKHTNVLLRRAVFRTFSRNFFTYGFLVYIREQCEVTTRKQGFSVNTKVDANSSVLALTLVSMLIVVPKYEY